MDGLAVFLVEYREERRRLRAEDLKRKGAVTGRLAAIERQMGCLVDAIAEGVPAAAVKDRLAALERERAALAAEAAAIGDLERENVVELHPSAIDGYRARLDDLERA